MTSPKNLSIENGNSNVGVKCVLQTLYTPLFWGKGPDREEAFINGK